ncbi:hypothetical protein SDC9_127825 [bioreactor metagenome]|uniref:DUF2752 domain-containing protein n=1 Tax=bioreactor metagenome TaxID=1076179 RepID=A0A645CV69_9ZZZZ
MKSGTGRSKRFLADILILAVVFAAFFVLVKVVGSHTLCWFRTMTGLPCAGCGMTSAAKALLRGDIVQSLQFHAFLLPVAGVVLIFLLRNRVAFCGRLHRSRLFYPVFLGLFVLYFIVRMILYFPSGPYPMTCSKPSVISRIYEKLTGRQ